MFHASDARIIAAKGKKMEKNSGLITVITVDGEQMVALGFYDGHKNCLVLSGPKIIETTFVKEPDPDDSSKMILVPNSVMLDVEHRYVPWDRISCVDLLSRAAILASPNSRSVYEKLSGIAMS